MSPIKFPAARYFESALKALIATPSELDKSDDAKVKTFWRDHWGDWQLRAPHDAAKSPSATRFLDQRRKRTPPPGHSHFVTLADYRPQPFSQPWIGERLKAMAAKGGKSPAKC